MMSMDAGKVAGISAPAAMLPMSSMRSRWAGVDGCIH